MKKKPATPFDAAELRCQAEVKLSERNKKAAAPPARVTETMRLVHELEVHQIELEMQNEELAQSRAKVEALLRQYTNLYDFAPVGYFTLARDGAIHQANLAGANLLGVERGKLITRRFGLFVSSESRPAFNTFLEKVFSSSGSKESCDVAFLKDGPDPLWAQIRATTEDGQERCYIVAVDITERKRAEKTLAASENRFRALVENAPDAISLIGADGTVVYDSQAVPKFLGYEIGKLISHNAFALIHPDDLPHIAPLFQQLLTDPSARVNSVFRFPHKDGSWRWIEATASNMVAKSSVQAVVINYRDITERKQAEETLRESEKRFHSLFENMLNGFAYCQMLFELERPSDFIYLEVNNAFETLTGLKNVSGKKVSEVIPGIRESDPGLFEIYGRVALTGIPETFETYVEALRMWFSISVYSPEKEYFVVVFDVITERKRAEGTLRQRLAELEALHTVSAALRMAQTCDEVLPILLDETLAVLETDADVVWLYHPEHDELRIAATRGWFRQVSETPMKPGEGIVGTVFVSGQSYVSTELRSDLLTRVARLDQIPDGWGGAFVPIHKGAVTIGVLLVSMPLPRQITPEQVKLLESLAEMAGTALHRMSLREETVLQLARLQSLHNIDLAITASFDLRMTLNILLEHVVAQLQVDTASVLLLNPHLQTLEYAAGHGFRTRAAQTIRIRLGESLAGRAALERRTVQAGDLAQIQENPQFAAFWAGEGFVAYYGIPLIAKGKVKGVLEVFHRAPLAAGPDWASFFEMLAGQAAIAIDNTQLFENLEHSNAELTLAYDATIEGWSHALDLRDKETEGHTLRVTEMTLRLAKAMGISETEIVHLRRGVLLHDIGKMGVMDAILHKPGPLSDAEWVVMRQHPQFALDMLAPISFLKPALDVPYCHHEKWDGTGYPRGLKGEQIPLTARLFAVVDVWEALRSDRPYRKAWSEKKVLEHIKAGSGTHFDPKAVELFLRVVSAKTEEHQGAG